jgi:perosamine synthetase
MENVMPMREIPLSLPDVTDLEIELVTDVLRSGRLALGPMAERFEKLVATQAGVRYGVAVNSGTSGLHLIMRALGIKPGDEVITTPFSFIASSNCILYAGAKPVFVDIDPRSLNMDPEKVEAAITPRTRAILAVETFGNPTHMDAYAAIAARHEITLIEDSCEALGTTWKGRSCGGFGRVGVFGFYPNKQITTGEGGCIVTDDSHLAELCRSMRNQGRALGFTMPRPGERHDARTVGAWLHHERLGYNYRMPDMNAALGVAQMRRLDEIIAKRQRVADAYMRRLMGNSHLVLPTIEPEARMSWFVYVVRLTTGYTRDERDRMIAGLRNQGVGAGDYFPCIHLQPFYREQFGFEPGQFPIAESVSQRTIALPFYNDLSDEDIEMACDALEVVLSRENLVRA